MSWKHLLLWLATLCVVGFGIHRVESRILEVGNRTKDLEANQTEWRQYYDQQLAVHLSHEIDLVDIIGLLRDQNHLKLVVPQ